ncbi:MAG: Mg-chelatase subunit ChlD [Mariniblastus sp.]|jgi:Mg-chelatase subunit ChlD
MRQDSSPPGWQGQTRDVPEVRHRWEQDWTSIQNKEFVEPPRKNQRRLFILLLTTVFLVVTLIYLLAFSPERTPLATICLQDYQWPLPPNRGGVEDLVGLTKLDQQNLDVKDISDSWQNSQLGLNKINEYLDDTLNSASRQPVCILYVSGHGAVNKQGEPCLILPGYAPRDDSNWLSIGELLQNINSRTPRSTKVLLVLDCVKERNNWKLGILNSTWATRLRQQILENSNPNLFVLCSAGDAQKSFHSASLRGTVFGNFVRLGLAGCADHSATSNDNSFGNRDGQVTLNELHQYVQKNVSQWVLFNRGDVQIPELIGGEGRDFRLTWALHESALTILETESIQLNPPVLQVGEITQLWEQLDKIKQLPALQFSPSKLSELEHRLLWIEDLAFSGDKRAIELSARIAMEMDEITAKWKTASTSMVARSHSFDPNSTASSLKLDLGSIALNECFGVVNESQAIQLREQFLSVSQLSIDDGNAGASTGLTGLPIKEAFLASRLRQAGELGIWPTTAPLARLADIHDLSERAGMPADLRIQTQIQTKVDLADANRRIAFDQLFVGSPERFSTACDRAENTLNQLLKGPNPQLDGLIDAYSNRDQALSDLPYVANWHLRWRLPTREIKSAERQIELASKRNQLSKMLVSLTVYSQELADPLAAEFAVSDASSPIEQWNQMRGELENSWQSLLTRQDFDVAALHELTEVLRTPLLPAKVRGELLAKQIKVEADLATSYLDLKNSNPKVDKQSTNQLTVEQASDQLVNESELQSEIKNHPLLVTLQISVADLASAGSDPKSTVLKQLENAAQFIRQRLQEIQSGSVPNQLALAKLSQPPSENPSHPRAVLQDASRLFRAAASLFSGAVEADPIADLRRFELHQLLVWQSKRVMDDFYGFPPGELSRELQKDPTFRVLAQRYLERLAQPDLFSESNQRQLDDLKTLLEERTLLATQAVRLKADVEVKVDEDENAKLSVTLNSDQETTESISPLTRGEMVLRLAADGQPLSLLKLESVFPLASETTTDEITIPSDLYGQYDQLIAYFRGHEYRTSVLSKGVNGYLVQWEANTDPSSKVSLNGDRRGRSSIVFVLDCSQSMGDEIQAESVGDQFSPRLELAKSALATMLSEISQRRDTRAGVRFFGHRIGWSTDQPTTAMTQDQYQGEIPDGLIPENDVELILPVGRFTETESQAVLKQMKSIKPWGQSPLYLTLLEAIKDFEYEPADVERSIVVITDGLNYQFSPASTSLQMVKKTGIEDLVAELNRQQIPIYILGFGISEQEKAAAAREFQSIAESSNGRYLPVENGSELLDVLGNQLQLGQFLIEGKRRESNLETQNAMIRLGENAALPTPGDYSLVFDSIGVPFVAEGGEKLEFYLMEQEGSPVIRSLPFKNNSHVSATMNKIGDSRQLTARIQRPQAVSKGIEFPVSFQFESQPFTPRPNEIWIEITPVEANSSGVPPISHVFFDRHFENGTPVPVTKWLAQGWPKTTQKATCAVYCKFSDTPPTHTIPVSQWIENKELGNAIQTVPGVDGLQFSVELGDASTDDYYVKIVEKHQAASRGLFSVRIDLKGNEGSRPDRTRREFNVRDGIASHTFYFKSEAFRDRQEFQNFLTSNQTKISFTTKAELLRNAWKLTNGPIEFSLGTGQGVLPKDAANGKR